MSKKRIILIIVAVLVALTLITLTIFVIRNVNEKPPVVVDQNRNSSSSENTSSQPTIETFTSTLRGVDDIHWGQGTVTIADDADAPTLSFQDDFKVAQGPDLFVYLSPNAAGQDLGEFASLGKLQANEGAQEYILPANYKDYKTVVIWCRAFGVTFAQAEFDFS